MCMHALLLCCSLRPKPSALHLARGRAAVAHRGDRADERGIGAAAKTAVPEPPPTGHPGASPVFAQDGGIGRV
jgi:hypothetical protein